MKLLVDNQLPVALARYLAENGFDCRMFKMLAWTRVMIAISGSLQDLNRW
jgi:predicted nuclease of predicted toxin-antitoxin system